MRFPLGWTRWYVTAGVRRDRGRVGSGSNLDRVVPRVNVEGTGVFDDEVEAPTPAVLS